MPTSTFQPLNSLTVGGLHTLATCWSIVRTDSQAFYFTSHDSPLTIDGVTYEPSGSFNATAVQRTDALTPTNFETRGALTSDKITEADLRAGLFREAEVTEFVVDWRYPWAGKWSILQYIIESTEFSREQWIASIAGRKIKLRPKKGDLYNKGCRWDFGDENCTKNKSALSVSGTVSTVMSGQLRFLSDVTSQDNDYFADGILTWTSGDNDGVSYEVKKYVKLTGEFDLYLPTLNTIQTGDTFSVVPGCDLQEVTCRERFNNISNFGGFPFIPGTDDALDTPGTQQ